MATFKPEKTVVTCEAVMTLSEAEMRVLHHLTLWDTRSLADKLLAVTTSSPEERDRETLIAFFDAIKVQLGPVVRRMNDAREVFVGSKVAALPEKKN